MAWRLDFSCISANLQSAVGKAPFLEQQMDNEGICVGMFQETKCKSGAVKSQRFVRLHSDACQHWGVAVWISCRIPIGWDGGRPVFVQESSINVLDQGPRHIIVCAKARNERLCFISAHYPQQARPKEERRDLQNAIDKYWSRIDVCRLIVGADANGKLPIWFEALTGGRQVGVPDDPGYFFAEAWARRGMWVPSTFDDCHDGEDFTYTHPRGHRSRIDFILLSSHFRTSEVQSRVDKNLDLLNSNTAECDLRCVRKRFDAKRLQDPQVRRDVSRRLDAIPLETWDVDVNRHADLVQQHSHDVLQAVIPWDPAAPHKRRSLKRSRGSKAARQIVGRIFDVMYYA